MAEERVTQPRSVQVMPEAVVIEWDDGHYSAYPHRALRLQCRCAACIGEWPRQGSLDPEGIPQDVSAIEYQTVGRYALQFIFSDAHYTGIYPYRFLRDVCPCPECAEGRGRE